jgi:hypothetical protein
MMLAGMIGGWEIVMVGLVLGVMTLGLALFGFWVWMLVDCVRNQSISGNERVVWVLVIVLTHFLGALIYFFAGRTSRAHAQPPPLPHAS